MLCCFFSIFYTISPAPQVSMIPASWKVAIPSRCIPATTQALHSPQSTPHLLPNVDCPNAPLPHYLLSLTPHPMVPAVPDTSHDSPAALPAASGQQTRYTARKKGANLAPLIKSGVLMARSTIFGVRLAPLWCQKDTLVTGWCLS